MSHVAIDELVETMESYPAYYKVEERRSKDDGHFKLSSSPVKYTFVFKIKKRVWFMEIKHTHDNDFAGLMDMGGSYFREEYITIYNSNKSFKEVFALQKFINFQSDMYTIAGDFPETSEMNKIYMRLWSYEREQDTRPDIVRSEQVMMAMYDKFSELCEEFASRIDALADRVEKIDRLNSSEVENGAGLD